MLLRRLFTYLIVFIFSAHSVLLVADDFSDAIQDGKSDGASFVNNWESPQFDVNSGMTYKDQTGTSHNVPPSDMMQGLSGSLSQSYSDNVGDDASTTNTGTLEHSKLSTENSHYGDSYNIIRDNFDGGVNEPPNLINDPITTRNQEILDPAALPTDMSCNTSTVWTDTTRTAHVPDLRYCTDVPQTSLSCILQHTVDVDFIDIAFTDGLTQISQCANDPATGFPCVQLRIGAGGDNTLGGSCKIFHFYTKLRVLNPDAIDRVQLVSTSFDDHIALFLDDNEFYNSYPALDWRLDIAQTMTDLSQGYENGGYCETGTNHWRSLTHIDITPDFKSAQPGDELDLGLRVAVSGGGEATFYTKFYVDPSKVPIHEEWFSQQCLDEAVEIEASPPPSFCSTSMTCEEELRPSQTCGSSALWCPEVDDLANPPVSAIPKSCHKAKIVKNCGFDQSNTCTTDSSGSVVCDGSNIAQPDSCKVYRDDTTCAFVSSECSDYSSSGECLSFDEVYDCGYSDTVVSQSADTVVDCSSSPVRCMGFECVDDTSTTSNGFGKVSSIMETIEVLKREGSCDPVTGLCEIFKGEALDCKKAVALGGHQLQDCCHDPIAPDDFGQYLKLLSYAAVLDYTLELGGTEAVTSAYDSVSQVASDTYDAAADAAANAYKAISESITGAAESAATDAATDAAVKQATESAATEAGIMETAKQGVMEGAKWVLDKVSDDALGDMVFHTVENSAGEQVLTLNPAVSSVFGAIAAAYAAYQAAKILSQIVWSCDDDELQLATARGRKTCHFIGNYCKQELPPYAQNQLTIGIGDCIEQRSSFCCFSSPLSRIIMEQVKLQGISGNWGSAEVPNCSGITLGELSLIDWDLVDFTEWIDMLELNNVVDDPASMTIETLTGKGSASDPFDSPTTSLDRSNVQERVDNRFNNLDHDRYIENVEQGVKNEIVW